jgi:hypothetical protein
MNTGIFIIADGKISVMIIQDAGQTEKWKKKFIENIPT